jgi:hypothetical protein
MKWFDLPLYLLLPMLGAIPRITAEESLLAVQQAQVGGGNLKKEDATKVIRRWEQTAAMKPASRRKASAQEIRSLFSGLPGVEVITERAS